MHCHILPGIDDGSPDVDTSLRLIRGMMQLGITQAVATPHVMSDMYRNDAASIHAALAQLQAGLEAAGLQFGLRPAAEYMMDSYFFELLERNEPLLTIAGQHVLTEFSFGYMPDNIKQVSFAIITGGYIPVLAHPERYAFFHNDYRVYHFLKDLGFMLQVNLLSVTGYYGAPVARAARYILQKGLASFTGTDLHHERHLAKLLDPGSQKIFAELFKGKQWNEEVGF